MRDQALKLYYQAKEEGTVGNLCWMDFLGEVKEVKTLSASDFATGTGYHKIATAVENSDKLAIHNYLQGALHFETFINAMKKDSVTKNQMQNDILNKVTSNERVEDYKSQTTETYVKISTKQAWVITFLVLKNKQAFYNEVEKEIKSVEEVVGFDFEACNF